MEPIDKTPRDEGAPPGDPPFIETLPYLPPLPPDWPPRKPLAEHGYDPDRVYGLNRRFSLATLMVMMAGASVILAGMNAILANMNASERAPIYGALVVSLCVAVAIGQMFLFGGRQPRYASLIVGAAFWFLMPLVFYFVERIVNGPGYRSGRFGWVILDMFWGLIFGALPGYLAGCLVAGVLLVMDLTESMFARWRKAREPDDDPWPAPTGSPPEDSKSEVGGGSRKS